MYIYIHVYMCTYMYICIYTYVYMTWKQKGDGARKETSREGKGEKQLRGRMRGINIINLHDILERNCLYEI